MQGLRRIHSKNVKERIARVANRFFGAFLLVTWFWVCFAKIYPNSAPRHMTGKLEVFEIFSNQKSANETRASASRVRAQWERV